MMVRRMKPLLWILGFTVFFLVIGWTWSELPRPLTLFAPTWTRSYQLYRQPHAVWLDQYDHMGANLDTLARVLNAATKARQLPEIVIYAIPMRDLGQSSEGGFADYDDYLADNRLSVGMIQKFVHATSIHPVVYLEPDSIPLAVQYRLDHHGNAASQRIFDDRLRIIKILIGLYQGAGASVYLEAGHSGWFDYGPESVQRIADALNAANIDVVDGLATNVSNRQPILGTPTRPHNEAHYLERLLPLLNNRHLDVRVDTSRNGGDTAARQYYLSPDGQLIDNEVPEGRLVGHWETLPNEDIRFLPFFGKSKRLSRLISKEKYTFDPNRHAASQPNIQANPHTENTSNHAPTKWAVLTAPAWLDAVGDVQLGPLPTDRPPTAVSALIQHYRYIKPPDDCDGALNCPPGASKHDINAKTAARQPAEKLKLPPGLWTPH
jgi:hypothetical protein